MTTEPETIGELHPIGGKYGAVPLCLHCNRQPSRLVRMEGSRLVWLCAIHWLDYKGSKLT